MMLIQLLCDGMLSHYTSHVGEFAAIICTNLVDVRIMSQMI